MSKETLNQDGDSNNSQNQSINQEKILNGSSKDASKDSLELKFVQLVNKIDELIESQKTLVEAVINSNEEQKKSCSCNEFFCSCNEFFCSCNEIFCSCNEFIPFESEPVNSTY